MYILLSFILLLFFSCDSENNFNLLGCRDSTACNYNENATTDDDSCYYSEDECFKCVEDQFIVCTADWDPYCGCDGITYSNGCEASRIVVSGIPGECNDTSIIEGCLDEDACNYNPIANSSDDSCFYCFEDNCDNYPKESFDCDGSCLNCPNQFGSSQSFDLLTWNIEHFPKHNNTISELSNIIPVLKVDIIALQEIESLEGLEELQNNLGENWTSYKAYSDPGYGALSYLINTDEIEINQPPYTILSQYVYDFAWRPPYVLNITHNNTEYTIINIHYKCCGGSEDRRLESSIALENYISSNLNNNNVILLGDFNDLLIDDPNIFEPFLDEPNNYYFTDMEIGSGSPAYWSYPSWPSHLDHILISNELFELGYDTQTLLIGEDFYQNNTNSYDHYISDHRPVGIRIQN